MSYFKSSLLKVDNDTVKYDATGQLISKGGGGGGDASIDDYNISTATTYSSSKTEERLEEVKEEIEDEYGGTILSYNDTLAVLGVPPSPFYQYRVATPIMTSNSAPYNVCSAKTELTGHEAYKAFRRVNDGDGWMSQNNDVANSWIQYQFAEPKVIGRITIRNFDTDSPAACKQFKFQGSNNGSSYTDLATCDVTSNARGVMQSFDIENITEYSYYRLFVVLGYDENNVAFGQIDLMEKYVA